LIGRSYEASCVKAVERAVEVAGEVALDAAADFPVGLAFGPAPLLLTDDVSYGLPPDAYAHAVHNEYLVDDLHKIGELARSATHVGILSQAPDQLLETSQRARTILPELGLRYEARVACVVDGQCWGIIAMFRGGDTEDFSSADAALLHALSAPLAAGLRTSWRSSCPRSS